MQWTRSSTEEASPRKIDDKEDRRGGGKETLGTWKEEGRETESESDLSRVMNGDLTTRPIYFLRVTHLDRARRPARHVPKNVRRSRRKMKAEKKKKRMKKGKKGHYARGDRESRHAGLTRR